jgi:hypothetical protein
VTKFQTLCCKGNYGDSISQGKYRFLNESKNVVGEVTLGSKHKLDVDMATSLSWKSSQPTVKGNLIFLFHVPHLKIYFFFFFLDNFLIFSVFPLPSYLLYPFSR